MRSALILAAGYGERLRPLTLKVPKCLLPINGRPLLDIWLDACERGGVERVVINTHHLAGQVVSHLASRRRGPNIETIHEETLLGSAGTLARARGFFEGGDAFAIIYADTLVPGVDLDAMFRFHGKHQAILTMALHRTRWPLESGIVEISQEGRILAFEEKPARPASNLANAGIYIADTSLLQMLPEQVPADFGHDVLPLLAGEMFGLMLEGPVIDIGTPSRYRQAQELGRLASPAVSAAIAFESVRG